MQHTNNHELPRTRFNVHRGLHAAHVDGTTVSLRSTDAHSIVADLASP